MTIDFDLTGFALLGVEHVKEKAKFASETRVAVTKMAQQSASQWFDEIQDLTIKDQC